MPEVPHAAFESSMLPSMAPFFDVTQQFSVKVAGMLSFFM
jgi:hypothetical protein